MPSTIGKLECAERRAALLLIVASGLVATWSNTGLYADGSYFLLRMSLSKWFFIADPFRSFSEGATQVPVV